MTCFYSLLFPQNSEGGVARAPDGWWPPAVTKRDMMSDWSTPTFTLSGAFVDLQPNDAGVKIFSARMRRMIDGHKAATDWMEWLPVWIKGGTELREYAIPYFIEALDVIDRERSVLNRVTGDVIKAHLRMDAIDGHEVFTYSNEIGGVVLFSETVYEALKDCSGCSFSKVRASSAEAKA